MDVILKISSTPMNRLPEGAIYVVLTTKDANNIDGYRVEYVLMEDCGTTVVNVLHRDISPGNVTIKGGHTYLIDWGYAKLLCLSSESLDTVILKRPNGQNDYFQTDLAMRWRLD
ncbi:hypothetical protein H4S04_005845 [Coemansia sp. S16]|nr:hypothetical protein H4S04_005845 [Coemansia sp. S16]